MSVMTMAACRPVHMSMNTATPWAMPEFLDQRGFHAFGALHLESGMGNMILVEEQLFDVPQDTRLLLLVFRPDVDMRGKRQNVGTDGPEVEMMDIVDPFDPADRFDNL